MKSLNLSSKDYMVGLSATFTYLVISLYLVNYQLILQTLFSNYPPSYKITLLTSLATGTLQMLPRLELLLILLTAVLVGTNLTLISKLLKRVKNQGQLKFSSGGTSLLAVAGAGCPSCGISILSILGVSSSILPLQGVALQLLTIGLLIASLAYNLKKLNEKIACSIPSVQVEKLKPI